MTNHSTAGTGELTHDTPTHEVGLLLPAIRQVPEAAERTPATQSADSLDFVPIDSHDQAVTVELHVYSWSFGGSHGDAPHDFEDLAAPQDGIAEADVSPVLMVIADQQDFYYPEYGDI